MAKCQPSFGAETISLYFVPVRVEDEGAVISIAKIGPKARGAGIAGAGREGGGMKGVDIGLTFDLKADVAAVARRCRRTLIKRPADPELRILVAISDRRVEAVDTAVAEGAQDGVVEGGLPIRLSPTPTICSVSPWTAGKGRRRRIEEAIRLILDCSENRTGV